MPANPFVLVTATTESLRGRSRVRVNEAYTSAIADVGLVPLVLPPVDVSLAMSSLNGVAGLVLTGGEDIDPAHFGQTPHPSVSGIHPGRDACEIALSRTAARLRIPTFAICRGAQVMNVALGGTLVQDIPSQHRTDINHDQSVRRTERVHDIVVDKSSLLARIVGAESIAINSSHHQSVDIPAPTLHVTARSSDGIVEALEPNDPDWWMVAVQWHPEELTATPEDWDRRLFTAFAQAVRGPVQD